MGRRRLRWLPAPVTTLLLSLAVALVGNMATNTVDPPASWLIGMPSPGWHGC
jgi:hypothetical protein